MSNPKPTKKLANKRKDMTATNPSFSILHSSFRKPAQAFPIRRMSPLKTGDNKLRARTFKYLSLWEGIYKKWGWTDKSETEKKDLRHGINIDLFGEYTPPSRLSNEQFSIMRFALELLENEGILVWSKQMADLAREEGLRRIYTWWIEHAGLDVEGIEEYGAPEDYISAIARDRFNGTSDWHTLDSTHLWQLFITIKNRVKAAKKRGVSLWRDTVTTSKSANEDLPF